MGDHIWSIRSSLGLVHDIDRWKHMDIWKTSMVIQQDGLEYIDREGEGERIRPAEP